MGEGGSRAGYTSVHAYVVLDLAWCSRPTGVAQSQLEFTVSAMHNHHHAVIRRTEEQHWCATELVLVPAHSLVSADIVHVCSGWLTTAVFLTADNV